MIETRHKVDLGTKKRKVGLVRCESEHDQVRIEAAEAVPCVGVVSLFVPRASDVVHDLVLAFPRDAVARVDDFETSPERIVFDLLANKVLKVLVELGHKLGTGGNAVGVEQLSRVLLRNLSPFNGRIG